MHTCTSLKNDFQKLGLAQGMTVLVHASLKSLGDVCGGPVAVIHALEEIIGKNGTLIMPTHTNDLTDPAGWSRPPAPEGCIDLIRDEMPAYDRNLSPTRNMGFIAETFRKQDAVIRSNHPHLSFSAWGRHANNVCDHHALEFGLGEESPLARIYDLNGHVMLLGVGHDKNTSMHLAEVRQSTNDQHIKQRAPMLVNGQRKWIEFDDLDYDDSSFAKIGDDFEQKTDSTSKGLIGDAKAKLMPQVPLVDFTQQWMANNCG